MPGLDEWLPPRKRHRNRLTDRAGALKQTQKPKKARAKKPYVRRAHCLAPPKTLADEAYYSEPQP